MDDLDKKKLDILNADLESIKQISQLLDNIFKVDQLLVASKETRKPTKNSEYDLDYQHITEFAELIYEEIQKTREDILTEKHSILARQKKQQKLDVGPSAIVENLRSNNDENIDKVCKVFDANGRCVENQCPIERIKGKVLDFKEKKTDASINTLEKFTKLLEDLETMNKQVENLEVIADTLAVFSSAFEKVPSRNPSRRSSMSDKETEIAIKQPSLGCSSSQEPPKKSKFKQLCCCCFQICDKTNKDHYEVISGVNRE